MGGGTSASIDWELSCAWEERTDLLLRLSPAPSVDDILMIAGTGGTTGKPKGVMLTGWNIETMSALTLMSYPFEGRTVYLALAPLTHAAGVLCFPIMTLGGEIIIMPRPDLAEFLALIEEHRVTHTFLPPTLIYMLLRHPDLASKDLASLQCLWYGAAPMSATRLKAAHDPKTQKYGVLTFFSSSTRCKTMGIMT